MIKNGTGADRQLEIFKQTNDLTKVVDFITEQTILGL
jgi:carboxylate-amine ligase